MAGHALLVGNETLLAERSIDVSPLRGEAMRLAEQARTPVYVAIDGELAGLLAVADPIKATSREEACAILADLIRQKALDTASGPTHRLREVMFGSHAVTATKGGMPISVRSPMSWTLEEIPLD